MVIDIPQQVTSEVAEKLISFQPRCLGCGSTYAMHIHHRIFRSEGEHGLQHFLKAAIGLYSINYGVPTEPWFMHSIQNLVRLCQDCHEGDSGRGVHGGNTELREKFRNSFTCPKTGFNVPYIKPICHLSY